MSCPAAIKGGNNMKKHPFLWMLRPAVLLILLPWLLVQWVRSDAGFAVILLLLFGVDPVCCFLYGLWAGKDVRQRWFMPFAAAGLFLLGTWLSFEMGEPAFVTYAVFYLLLGLAAMGISWMLTKRRSGYGEAGQETA